MLQLISIIIYINIEKKSDEKVQEYSNRIRLFEIMNST